VDPSTTGLSASASLRAARRIPLNGSGSDFVGVPKKVRDRQIRTHGRVIDSVTGDFPEPSAEGRVLVLLSTP
jgi:hypothetical protein